MNEELNTQNNEDTEITTFSIKDGTGKEYSIPEVVKSGDTDVNLKELFSIAIGREKSSARKQIKQYESQIQELQHQMDEIVSTKDEELMSKLPEKDRTIRELQKQLDTINKNLSNKDQELSSLFGDFRSERIQREAFNAFSDYDLHNQSQTLKIFMSEADVKFEKDENSKYNTIVSMELPDNKGDTQVYSGGIKDVFSKWIALDSNAYLLRNSLDPGSGSLKTKTKTPSSNKLVFTREEMRNPEYAKDYRAKMKAGVEVRIVD